ncbi:MAG: hypothetical protein WC916_01610 [Candidatus Woesearchaeota archaeon]
MNNVKLFSEKELYNFKDRRASIIGTLFDISIDDLTNYAPLVLNELLPESTHDYICEPYDFNKYNISFCDNYVRDFAVAAAINYELASQQTIAIPATPATTNQPTEYIDHKSEHKNGTFAMPLQHTITISSKNIEDHARIARNCLVILGKKYSADSRMLPPVSIYTQLISLLDAEKNYYTNNPA